MENAGCLPWQVQALRWQVPEGGLLESAAISPQELWPPGSRELRRGAEERPLSKDPERKPRAGLLVLLREFEGGNGEQR